MLCKEHIRSLSCLARAATSSTCCRTVEAWKRMRLVIISASTQPVAHMSTAVLVGRAPTSSSGAAYASVPRTSPHDMTLTPRSADDDDDDDPASTSLSRSPPPRAGSDVPSMSIVVCCFVTRPKSPSYSHARTLPLQSTDCTNWRIKSETYMLYIDPPNNRTFTERLIWNRSPQ